MAQLVFLLYGILIPSLLILEETLACEEKDVYDIADVLLDVNDWKGLAIQLEVKAGRIRENCKDSSEQDVAKCYRRGVVREFCNTNGLEVEEAVEKIAQALVPIGNKRQAKILRNKYLSNGKSIGNSPTPPSKGPDSQPELQSSMMEQIPWPAIAGVVAVGISLLIFYTKGYFGGSSTAKHSQSPVVRQKVKSSNISKSVALRALRKSYQIFSDGVDPDHFATVLNSKLLLTREEFQRTTQRTETDHQKLQEILKALERRISVNPNVFRTMLEVLLAEPALEEVGHRIEEIYDEECGRQD